MSLVEDTRSVGQRKPARTVQPLRWRLSVSLKDGTYTQTATIDFVRRETIDVQLVQLLFKQHKENWARLYEFTNEFGELLAFRATAYGSHAITALDG